MFEDCIAFAANFLRAEGYGHFDLVYGPFLPGTAIKPDFAVAIPVVVADLVAGEDNGFEADAVSAMGVGEISCGIDLVWLQLSQERDDDVDVGFGEGLFLDATGFVEWHIEEAEIGSRDAAAASPGDGLAFANQPFNHLHLWAVDLAGLFASEKFFDVVFKFPDAVGHQPKGRTVVGNKFSEPQSVIIEDSNVAGSLVGDVDVVALIRQSNEGATHRNDIIIGVRGEAEHAFGKDVIKRPGTISGTLFEIGLSAWPADDGALQVTKDVEVDFVGRSVFGEQVLETTFVVIGVSQLEDGFIVFF
jgi:hypothetical protein